MASAVPLSTPIGETVRVSLAPSAGFCIKSVTTQPGFYTYVDVEPSSSSASSSTSAASSSKASISRSASSNLLEPTKSRTRMLQIPVGMKVFLNIAWDKRVPAPPEVREEVVRRAMAGADLDEDGGYYVPVVVSEPREDLDKSGKPSIIFDCVFNASLKARCLKDREFKLYLIELALEHVEEKAHMTLSRQVGTPNIASKGKLEPRTVLMPKTLVDPKSVRENLGTSQQRHSAAPPSPLIQELPDKVTDGDGGGGSEDGLGGKNRTGVGIGIASPLSPSSSSSPSEKPQNQPLKSILKPTASANTSAVANVPGARSNDEHSAKRSVNTGPPLPSFSTPTSTSSTVAGGNGALIQEVEVIANGNGSGNRNSNTNGASIGLDTDTGAGLENLKTLTALPPLRWKWIRTQDGDSLKTRIEVDVPEMTHDLHAHSTLDVEARRILFHIPQRNFLDINLSLSDEQIGKVGSVPSVDLGFETQGGGSGLENLSKSIVEAMQLNGNGSGNDKEVLSIKGHNAGELLRLKREKDQRRVRKFQFDVANARAEWRVKEKKLVITV